MKTALQASMLYCVSAVLVACGGGGSNSADSAVDASGCGTHANPGILKLTGLTPATGTSVLNQNIVHGFVVENAPAFFTAFTLRYGDAHTAGISTPFGPTFQVTVSGSNLIYQMTIDAWSLAPGHVEIVASGSYDTLKGCTWAFPSPLFSYDVTPVLDAGVAGETRGVMDGGGMDSGANGPYDVPIALDSLITAEVPGEIDDGGTVAVDATVDGGSSMDAGLD
jgi:hypothetical protein